MDKFVRDDHPDGAEGAHGPRWKLASPRLRGDAVEVYGLKFGDGGVRLSVTDYRSGTNTADHGCVCMDLASATELAQEILHQVAEVSGKPAIEPPGLRQRISAALNQRDRAPNDGGFLPTDRLLDALVSAAMGTP